MNKRQTNQVIDDTKKILYHYTLCDHCLGRMFATKLGVVSHERLGLRIRTMLKQKRPKSCYICKDLMWNLELHFQKVLDVSKGYQFSTFLIGAVIQPSIHDRDDVVRSKFKLRGIPSIKSDVTREMGKWFARKTRTKVDYQNPDIVFTIDFRKNEYEIKPKAVFLQGRYTKSQRGLPQKQKPCENCSGKGCFICDFHGIKDFGSIEGKIAKFLYEKFEVQQVRVTWLGSEDESSLVKGNGRPFFVKLSNPHKRYVHLPKKLDLNGVIIHGMRIISKIPTDPIRFRTEVVLEVETEGEVSSEKIDSLKELKNEPLVLYENFGPKSKKRIYAIKLLKRSGKILSLLMVSDGGIPIKRFVTGHEIDPSLSTILETRCTCKLFDFNKILITKQVFIPR